MLHSTGSHQVNIRDLGTQSFLQGSNFGHKSFFDPSEFLFFPDLSLMSLMIDFWFSETHVEWQNFH